MFAIIKRPLHTFLKSSDIQPFKKCKFQAHAYQITAVQDVSLVVQDLLAVKKIRKASHPHIFAYRLRCGTSGFDDNGEKGAGRRLLTLLENRNLDNIFVAVSRFYGGSHLGGARFRAITNCAKTVLED
jgi:putative IMPACT (imprinted ancient) family translation regulator